MGHCALINGECPETANPAKSRFCPHWKTGIPDVVNFGFVAAPAFTGCFLEKLPAYLIAVARDAAHSAAAFNEARDTVLGKNAPRENVEQVLAALGTIALGGAIMNQRAIDESGGLKSLKAPQAETK